MKRFMTMMIGLGLVLGLASISIAEEMKKDDTKKEGKKKGGKKKGEKKEEKK